MTNLLNQIPQDQRDFQICRMLLQFHKFGALVNYEIYILEDNGFITTEERHFLPFADQVTIVKFTSRGLKNLDLYKKKWRDVYLPQLEMDNPEIPDTFSDKNAYDYSWGYSLERLEKEGREGRFGQAVKASM